MYAVATAVPAAFRSVAKAQWLWAALMVGTVAAVATVVVVAANDSSAPNL